MNRKKAVTGILAAAVCILAGCGSQDKEHMVSKKGFFFDTMISISIEAEDKEKLLDDCLAMCADYEKTFSRIRQDSELYKVNHRTEDTVQVSDDLYALLSAAETYYQVTEGKFDISVAPLSDLWDFKSEDPALPQKAEIEEALADVDFSRVTLREDNKVQFDDPETMLDLGALAKGYIADRLKEYLVSQGAEKGIINLGGNVLTIGKGREGQPWKVGIQKPFAERNEILTYVEAEDCSVVSSGIYERYFEKDGNFYYHVLDPDTGYPVETDLCQVTVISESSLAGDGLSTSCLILGYEKGKELIESLENTEAVFVLKNGNIKTTGGLTLPGKE